MRQSNAPTRRFAAIGMVNTLAAPAAFREIRRAWLPGNTDPELSAALGRYDHSAAAVRRLALRHRDTPDGRARFAVNEAVADTIESRHEAHRHVATLLARRGARGVVEGSRLYLPMTLDDLDKDRSMGLQAGEVIGLPEPAPRARRFFGPMATPCPGIANVAAAAKLAASWLAPGAPEWFGQLACAVAFHGPAESKARLLLTGRYAQEGGAR